MVKSKSVKIEKEEENGMVWVFNTNLIINANLPAKYILISETPNGWFIQSEGMSQGEVEAKLRQYHDLIMVSNDQDTFKELAPPAEPEEEEDDDVSYR